MVGGGQPRARGGACTHSGVPRLPSRDARGQRRLHAMPAGGIQRSEHPRPVALLWVRAGVLRAGGGRDPLPALPRGSLQQRDGAGHMRGVPEPHHVPAGVPRPHGLPLRQGVFPAGPGPSCLRPMPWREDGVRLHRSAYPQAAGRLLGKPCQWLGRVGVPPAVGMPTPRSGRGRGGVVRAAGRRCPGVVRWPAVQPVRRWILPPRGQVPGVLAERVRGEPKP
mmetsp:Transcript_5263/g.17468  ORF Transcript_5263/g.17468 Transcript_5263/m.17468 type:complete len:222 (-) Transcript_5263:37-702(-)